jgi:hypothetical protein
MSSIKKIKKFVGAVSGYVPVLFALAVVLCMAEMAQAQNPDLIPAIPVNMSALTTELLTKLGGVLQTAITASLAIFVVVLGVKYIKKWFRGA